jgi:hypothetical protein
MKNFTLTELSTPSPYLNPELEKLCRQAFRAAFTSLQDATGNAYATRGEARDAVFAGSHSEWVFELVGVHVVAEQAAADKIVADALAAKVLKKATAAANKITRAAKAAAAEIAEIERWLGYVENKAPEGWVYEKGVNECIRLGIPS